MRLTSFAVAAVLAILTPSAYAEGKVSTSVSTCTIYRTVERVVATEFATISSSTPIVISSSDVSAVHTSATANYIPLYATGNTTMIVGTGSSLSYSPSQSHSSAPVSTAAIENTAPATDTRLYGFAAIAAVFAFAAL